jgi:serine/threonine protein phosphatase PrpC
MGNTLPKPIITKTTETGGGCDNNNNNNEEEDYTIEVDDDNGVETNNGVNTLKWGVSSMQGWRVSMEDAHIVEAIRQIQDPESGELIVLDEVHYFFCVLDGHGGSMAAEYAGNHFRHILQQRPEFVEYARLVGQVVAAQEESPPNRRAKNNNSKSRKNRQQRHRQTLEDIGQKSGLLLQRALEDAFVELDLQLLKEMVHQNTFELAPDPTLTSTNSNNNIDSEDNDWGVELFDPELGVLPRPPDKPHSASGTTATAALVTPDLIICANVGDSRTIIDAYPLSTDHKPTLPEERQRILDAHGMIHFGRVDGELAVSRAIGDFEFKAYNQSHLIEGHLDMERKRRLARTLKVSPFPEITCHYRSDIDQALILACDGIWDVMSNRDCHELVQMLCEEGESNVGLIAEEIIDTCLKQGSRDNMTVLVALLPAQAIGMGGGVLKRRSRRRRSR